MAKREKNPERIAMEDYASYRLRTVRSKLGMTQNQLADLLAFKSENTVDPKTIYRWESGEHPVPAWALLHAEMLDEEIEGVPQDKTERKMEPLVSKVISKVRDVLKSGS